MSSFFRVTAIFAGGNLFAALLRAVTVFITASLVAPEVLGMFTAYGLIIGYLPFLLIDVLINNHHYLAKQAWDSRAENYPEEAWKGIIDVNLTGTFLMCREFGRVMLQQGKGNIINVASTYGVVSSNPALYQDNTLASPVAYSASKGGVIMLTKYLASYWGERGVRVNAITPHGVWNSQEKSFEKRFNQMTPFKVSTVFPRS